MRVVAFCEAHELSENIIHAQLKRKNWIERGAVYYDNYGKLRVNEKFFIRRIEFRKKVKLFNQDMYYFLTEHFTETELARSSNTSIDYINSKLFNEDNTTILRSDISGSDWKFFRFGRKVLHSLNKRYGTKISVSYILDRRMNAN